MDGKVIVPIPCRQRRHARPSLRRPAILSALVGVLAALVALTGGTSDTSAASLYPGLAGSSFCATSRPIAGMSADQAQNARVVAATASLRADDRAALIAVKTPLTGAQFHISARVVQSSLCRVRTKPGQGSGFDPEGRDPH